MHKIQMQLERITLVTTSHVSYNPRLVKEADALHAAGYEIRVIAMRTDADKSRWDERLMSKRGWQLERLDVCRDNFIGRFRWFKATLRQRLYQRSSRMQAGRFGFELAYSRYFPELVRLAQTRSAGLFLAHNLAALPASAAAARRCGAKLGFDAEDFHRGEFADEDLGCVCLRKLTMRIEEKYIPSCQYFTAASEGIADAYTSIPGVPKPAVILNVFPLSERKGHVSSEELRKERGGPGLSLYWYSQIIGGDRGLNDVLEAMKLLGSGVFLRLRGSWAGGYEQLFLKKIKELKIDGRVCVLPRVPPEELVERAGQHDVGLALEPGNRPNNRLATSNKLLTYILAGLAIAATDVPGQRSIMNEASDAGVLYTPGDAEALAKHLRHWRDRPEKLSEAKARSRRYAETRFCWDIEKHKLIRSVERISDE